MARVDDVAAAIIDRLGSLTAMKLEKLVYYCQCWHLAFHNESLFDEPIEAWRQGPVVPSLFQRHRGQYMVHSWDFGHRTGLNDIQQATVDWVSEKYGPFTPIELSRMTHSELPWRQARGGLPDHERSDALIGRDIIRLYYSRQMADPETAIALATASAALEGVELGTDWQDRLRDLACGAVTADQLVAEELSRYKSRR